MSFILNIKLVKIKLIFYMNSVSVKGRDAFVLKGISDQVRVEKGGVLVIMFRRIMRQCIHRMWSM